MRIRKHWMAILASLLLLAALLDLIEGDLSGAAICGVLSLLLWENYWLERRSWVRKLHEGWSPREVIIWRLGLVVATVILVLSLITALGSWAVLGANLIVLSLGLMRYRIEVRQRRSGEV